VLWLTSFLNAVFRQLGVNEPLAQVPHQQAILERGLPNLTEEGYPSSVKLGYHGGGLTQRRRYLR
jgi:hypothetical protein